MSEVAIEIDALESSLELPEIKPMHIFWACMYCREEHAAENKIALCGFVSGRLWLPNAGPRPGTKKCEKCQIVRNAFEVHIVCRFCHAVRSR